VSVNDEYTQKIKIIPYGRDDVGGSFSLFKYPLTMNRLGALDFRSGKFVNKAE
jgi:hypothetical protein